MSINVVKFTAFISSLTLMFNKTIDENDASCIINDIENMTKNNGEKINLIPMFDAILGYRKIDAIREYRALTGFGLKESKDEIERIMNKMVAPR